MNKKTYISLRNSLLLVFALIAPLILIKLVTMLFSANSSGHQQLIGGFQPSIIYLYLILEGFMLHNSVEILQSITVEIILLSVVLTLSLNSLLKLKKIDKDNFIIEIRNDGIIKIIFIGFLMILLASSFLGLYVTRYLLLLFPLFIIVLARGYTNIKSQFLKTCIGLLFIVLAFIAFPTLAHNTNTQITDAAKQIMLQEKDKDLIIILPPEHFWDFSYYYNGSLPIYDLFINYLNRNNQNNALEIIRIKSGGTINEFNLVTPKNVNNLDTITANYGRVWLILADGYLKKDPDSLIEKYFIKNWQLISYDAETKLYLFKRF